MGWIKKVNTHSCALPAHSFGEGSIWECDVCGSRYTWGNLRWKANPRWPDDYDVPPPGKDED